MTVLNEESAAILYAIRLTDERYFIHVQSDDGHTRSNEQIMELCVKLYKYVDKYRPLEIVDIVYSIDPIQIDRFVLQYMLQFGIEYVRGGSFSSENLSRNRLKMIEKQLDTIVHLIPSTDKHIKEIERNQSESLESKYKKYLTIKTFEYNDKIYAFNREYLRNELPWLFDHVDAVVYNHKYGISPPYNANHKQFIADKYKTLMVYIRELPKLYNRVLGSNHDWGEMNVYLANPEFLFDLYIYHSTTRLTQRLYNPDLINRFQEIIMDMYYTVANYISEMEFEYYSL